jgi:hypothetical protein
VPRRLGRLSSGLAVAAVASLALSASAAAATACSVGTLSQPFKPWLDAFSYGLVPGARFESGTTGWKLSSTAKVVTGNEPWRVAGASDAKSLSLAAGATATTPTFCGGLGYPTVRLFSKSSFALVSLLRVDVVYTGTDALLHSSPLGTVLPSGSGQPSLPIVTLSGLPLLTGSSLALRLTAVGATFTVDDIYVDPYSRN